MDLRILTILLPAALGQIHPDVHFDNDNDRFDLSTLIQQGAYEQWGEVMDGVRRSDGIGTSNNDTEKVSNATAKFMKALQDFQQNFQFNDTEHVSNESEDPNEKMQLRRDLATYLHDNQADLESRRSGQIEIDPEREAVMHHAVPIVMKLQGIMQMPKKDK